MKNFIILSLMLLGFMSCTKIDVTPKDNNQQIVVPPPPIDTTTNNQVSLVGQKWVIKEYRIGQIGNIQPLNDTLTFNSSGKYYYNKFKSTYSFYPTGSVYNLTINQTPFGNLSGTVNDYNVIQGVIYGGKFVDISIGSSGQIYYLWMEKI